MSQEKGYLIKLSNFLRHEGIIAYNPDYSGDF